MHLSHIVARTTLDIVNSPQAKLFTNGGCIEIDAAERTNLQIPIGPRPKRPKLLANRVESNQFFTKLCFL